MHPEVDAYIDRVKQWQAEIQLLRTILLDCKLEETIKWGQPCYTMHDKNIVIIAPFKAHCDLGFFNGAVLKDEKQSETRINRIQNYRQRILSGIGINDCTCGLSKRMPSCDGSHNQLNLKK